MGDGFLIPKEVILMILLYLPDHEVHELWCTCRFMHHPVNISFYNEKILPYLRLLQWHKICHYFWSSKKIRGFAIYNENRYIGKIVSNGMKSTSFGTDELCITNVGKCIYDFYFSVWYAGKLHTRLIFNFDETLGNYLCIKNESNEPFFFNEFSDIQYLDIKKVETAFNGVLYLYF